MANLDLPKDLRNRVLLYIQNTHHTKLKQTEMKSFLKGISPSFQRMCLAQIFQILKKNFVIRYVMKDKRLKLSPDDKKK